MGTEFYSGVTQTFQFFEQVREGFLDAAEPYERVNCTKKDDGELQTVLEDTLRIAGRHLDITSDTAQDQLVDILQLVYEVAETIGINSQTLEALRHQKALRQGTYAAGVYIRALSVSEGTNMHLLQSLRNQPDRYPRVPDQAVFPPATLPGLADN